MANIIDSQLRNISPGDYRYAKVMSDNFNVIVNAINNRAIGSQNYGRTNVLSQHISTSQVKNSHFKNFALERSNISAGDKILNNDKVNWDGKASGVRWVGYNTGLSTGATAGVVVAWYSVSSTWNTDVVWDIDWSAAVGGNPGFTTTPVVMMVGVSQSDEFFANPYDAHLDRVALERTQYGSSSGRLYMLYNALPAVTQSGTFYALVKGHV